MRIVVQSGSCCFTPSHSHTIFKTRSVGRKPTIRARFTARRIMRRPNLCPFSGGSSGKRHSIRRLLLVLVFQPSRLLFQRADFLPLPLNLRFLPSDRRLGVLELLLSTSDTSRAFVSRLRQRNHGHHPRWGLELCPSFRP